MTLYEVMQSLFEKFGGYYEDLESLTFEGVEGAQKIKDIMSLFRNNTPEKIGEYKINKLTDYLGETPLPKSDVLYFELDNNVDFVIRPSGTEPKVKIYYLAKGNTYEDAKISSDKVKLAVNEIMKG